MLFIYIDLAILCSPVNPISYLCMALSPMAGRWKTFRPGQEEDIESEALFGVFWGLK